jgi:hypothetical protein
MSEWPGLPFDNLYKFVTVVGVGLTVVIGGALIPRLDRHDSTVVLLWALVAALLLAIVGGLAWFYRTQYPKDARARLARGRVTDTADGILTAQQRVTLDETGAISSAPAYRVTKRGFELLDTGNGRQ